MMMTPSDALDLRSRALAALHDRRVSVSGWERRAFSGSLFLVTDEMMALATHAAKTFQAQPWALDDMPSPDGMMVFGPFEIEDESSGVVYAVHGFTWSSLSDAMTLGTFGRMLRSGMGPSPVVIFFEKRILFGSVKLTHADCGAIAKNVALDDSLAYVQDLAETLSNLSVLPAVLFALMRETLTVDRPAITSISTEAACRESIRRARRHGVDASINVVKLRRVLATDGHEVKHGTVSWSCSWIVNGHWRKQWYSKAKCHRQIWIAPHLKGDQDKPLRIAETVHVLAK